MTKAEGLPLPAATTHAVTRVFNYGALPPVEGTEVLEQQLARGHRYRNEWVRRIRIQKSKLRSELMRILPIERLTAFTRQQSNGPTVPTTMVPVPPGDLSLKQLFLARRNWSLDKKYKPKAQREQALEAFDAYQRELGTELTKETMPDERRHSGLYWGTYQALNLAGRSASRHERPAYHDWDGTGQVCVHFQNEDVPTVEDLFTVGTGAARLSKRGLPAVRWQRWMQKDGSKPTLVVGPAPSERRVNGAWWLHLRVGIDKEDPWVKLPIHLHRDMPSDARVTWIRVLVTRVATHRRYEVQFIIDGPSVLAQAALPGPTIPHVVGVDVGWRKKDDGSIRVAFVADTAGRTRELVYPARLVQRWKKVEEVRSTRDKDFNLMLGKVLEQRVPAWPEKLRELLKYAHAWRSPEQLARVVYWWRENRFSGDEGLYPQLEAWRKHNVHLHEWEDNQRRSVIDARKHLYRHYALELAKYKTVVVEHLDLRQAAKGNWEEDDEKPECAKKRPRNQRFTVALSDLLNYTATAAWRTGSEWLEANPKKTTMQCSWCGRVDDVGEALMHTCSGCTRTWDQDHNAARNLITRAAECRANPPARSRQTAAEAYEVDAATGRKVVEKAKRRGKRSKQRR